MATAALNARRSMPVLALMFSLVLHAGALAALLTDWHRNPVDDIALSVELVIVSAPIDTPVDQPDPAPAAAAPPPQEPVPQVSEPPAPPIPAPAPPPVAAPAAPEPPKIVPKPEVARAAPPRTDPPKPVPPRAIEAPINLNPGSVGGEDTQQAKAPIGGEVSPAFSVLYGPIPPYPAQARSRGQEGRVVLSVTIAIDGTPSDVRVARGSGAPLLDESAVNTVKTWRFRNDSAGPLSVTVPIVFELRATAGR